MTKRTKFIIVVLAIVANASLLIWTGIKVDIVSLGMRKEYFNIGLVILNVFNTSVSSVLLYFGIRAPTRSNLER